MQKDLVSLAYVVYRLILKENVNSNPFSKGNLGLLSDDFTKTASIVSHTL